MTAKDWNPESYARFADLRLRPARDLLAQVGGLPAGGVVDLGCGAGAAGAMLRARFGERELTGLDTSPAMLAKAGETGAYTALTEADAATWQPGTPPALIFSNAALHWVGDHERLMPRLAGLLAPGGTLAVQMPHQNRAPSHRLWHDLVEQHFPGRFDPATSPGILEGAAYHRMLAPLGHLMLWETEYFQLLEPAAEGHPVRQFTSSTFARPVLAVLEPEEQAQLVAHYDAVMDKAYPRSPDGSVLFPFRRLFFTLVRA